MDEKPKTLDFSDRIALFTNYTLSNVNNGQRRDSHVIMTHTYKTGCSIGSSDGWCVQKVGT